MSAIALPRRGGMMIFSSRSLHPSGATAVPVRTHSIQHVIAVGWIPYVKRWRHIKDSSLHKYLEASAGRAVLKRVVMWLMCKSGNRDPQLAVYRSPDALKEFLKTREYRGAICVENIEISRVDEGLPRLAHTPNSLRDEGIGYTAVPVPWGALWLRRIGLYLKGHANDYPRPLDGFTEHPGLAYDPNDPSRVTFIHKVAFHACKLESASIKPVFKGELPYAWLEVQITIDFNSNQVNYNLTGSAIPSRDASSARAGEHPTRLNPHNMLKMEGSAVKGFFECKNKEAPEYPPSDR